MSYVEWLRVRNCLRVVAIVLGVLILGMLIVRIVFNSEINADSEMIKHVQMSPGATTSETTLADGTHRTTISDPSENTVVTIDATGPGIERKITITEPAANHKHNDNFSIGSIDVRENVSHGVRTTIINMNSAVPLWTYFIAGCLVALIVATILGAPLARENDGHLELAMTRPQPRYVLAIRTLGVDLAGIALSVLMTVAALIIVQTLFEIPHFAAIDTATLQVGALSFIGPFAWYALLAAATSSLNRGYGVVQGLSWLIAILVFVFGAITWNDSILGQVMHNVFMPLSYLDPLRYMETRMHMNDATGVVTVDSGTMVNIAMEAVLFIVYSALAIFQWQKVEA